MEAFEEVADSLCVPQHSKDGEERVVLFLKMASGHSFRPDLVKRIQDAIRSGLSARHVPGLILETKGIPVWPRRVPTHPGPLPQACSGFVCGLSLLPGNKSWFSCLRCFKAFPKLH